LTTMSTSSSSLGLYTYCQYLMDLREKTFILISRNSTWFGLGWNCMELTKNKLSWKRSFFFKRGNKIMTFLHPSRFYWNLEWHEFFFLKKYFSTSQVSNIRKEIYGIQKYHGKTLSKYWERFKQMCIQCAHH
jgi:hypothetical protein